MTSSVRRIRSERPCSPSAQRSASARFDLPEPLGPTTALMPGPNSTSVRSANDLNPWTRRPRRRAGALTARRPAPARRRDPRTPTRPALAASTLAAQDLERLRRGRRLGDPARRPFAHPEHPALDDHLDPELLLVVRADGLDEPVGRPLAGGPLGVLLEPALGALERGHREVGRQLLGGHLVDPVARDVPAEVEVDRADQRLERRREQRRPHAPAALRLALAEQQERAEVDAGREAGEPGRADDRRAARREHPLVVAGMALVERLGHGQAHDGVAEELEALVVARRGVGVLVQPAAVDERLPEQVAIADGKPEALRQGVGRVHRAPGRAI